MSRPDDFDILPDDPEEPRRAGRIWLWLLIAAGAIFIFAVGMALATFTNRLNPNDNQTISTATTLAGIATFTPTPPNATAAATTTVGTTVVAVPPTVATPIPPTAISQPATVAPTATAAQPTATVGCTRAVLSQLAEAYVAELGCPSSDAGIIWAAWEWFERGAMLWRDDNDRAYAFFNDGGWGAIDEKWEGQDLPQRGDPPSGLQAPLRGFGYAWGRRDDLFQRLGWATDQERGFCALVQNFDHGFILQNSDVEACKDNLFNQARAGDWRPIFLVAVDTLGWINFAEAPRPTSTAATPNGSTPAAPATATAISTITPPQVTTTATVEPTATPTTATVERLRPEGNGVFDAPTGAHTLDANFDDWSERWLAMSAVVEGAGNYTGSDDASGEFQLSWTLEGLYIAIRVRDDRYRAGPNGTDMWQGDAIELHFDRDLSGDYADTFANGDDYQLGLSWGPERTEVRLYRWLPQVEEGTFPVSGAVVADGEGYRAEVLIPWTLFDVTSGQLQSDQRFGFNLSISDNDADAPAQETLLSASPSRTTYNNPTEWGTLILQ